MSSFRLALAALLPLALAGCGVPDIVAHGVKSMEHNQGGNRNAANAPPPAAQPAPAYTPASVGANQRPSDPEAGFVPEPAPQRERVTAEPLR